MCVDGVCGSWGGVQLGLQVAVVKLRCLNWGVQVGCCGFLGFHSLME
jgi:hypothetical protein